MGQGIDAARSVSPAHAAMMDSLKDQLLIVFLKRLGGSVSVPVSEVDDTGGDLVSFSINDGNFNFNVSKKQ